MSMQTETARTSGPNSSSPAGLPRTMKAIVHERYGIDALEFREVDLPTLSAEQVLLRVHASSLNPVEYYGVTAPMFLRILGRALRRPKTTWLGADVAGTVEAVGADVTEFKPGDEVWGTSGAAWAEYAPAREVRLVRKPANVSWEEAAAVPIAAITALQALRDKGGVQPGQKVLVNGASGGVGTYAVQLAKVLGAEVTAVCSTRNVETAASLGADVVCDYTKEDFTRSPLRHELMIDIAGSKPFRQFKRVLTGDATIVVVGAKFPSKGGIGPLSHVLRTRLATIGRSQTAKFFIAQINKDDLAFLAGLLERGQAAIRHRQALRARPGGRRPPLPRRGTRPRQGGSHDVKAVVHDRYGPPEVLRLDEVERPVPRDDEVLVRIRATSVNQTDCHIRRAKPAFWRLFAGLRRPKQRTLGTELAGEVAAVGAAVTEFVSGDRVFGRRRFGTHAEYACVPELGVLAHLPDAMSFEEGAAVCDGAMQALCHLRRAKVGEGTRLLVYGASGSCGTAAVQLGRHFGAQVTAVCATKNLELVRSLGAEEVIDYTREDFTKNGRTYDVILDAVGKHSFFRCRRSLVPGGLFVATDRMHNLVLVPATSLLRRRKVVFPMPRPTKQDFHFLKRLLEAGEYRAVIDRCYPLDEVVEGTRYVESWQKTGNVIITV